MSYKIGKGQYAGRGQKNYPVEILDANNKVVESFTVYGNRGTAKTQAKNKIKELTDKE